MAQSKRVYLILFIFSLILIACKSDLYSSSNSEIHLEQFTEESVLVEFFIYESRQGEDYLAAKFTPQGERLHLYSKDLPIVGINGTGRPTLFEILSPENFEFSEVEQSVQSFEKQFPGFIETHLVYPAGPVTLKYLLPSGSDVESELQLEVSVTYMVCHSDGGCKPPVIDKKVFLTLP